MPATSSDQAVQEIWTVPEGSEVREEQMAALFGEGLHPNAVEITNYNLARGAQHGVAVETAQLGRRFAIRTGETEFQRALAVAYREHNAASGQQWNTPIADDVRAQIRTTLARQRFADEYGREPADDRELSGYHRPQHPRPHHRGRRIRRHLQPSQIRLGTVGGCPAGSGHAKSRSATTPRWQTHWRSWRPMPRSPAPVPPAWPRSTPPA